MMPSASDLINLRFYPQHSLQPVLDKRDNHFACRRALNEKLYRKENNSFSMQLFNKDDRLDWKMARKNNYQIMPLFIDQD